jgi:hypothetical protein
VKDGLNKMIYDTNAGLNGVVDETRHPFPQICFGGVTETLSIAKTTCIMRFAKKR